MTRKVFTDTETTGLDPKLNAIIEIGGIIEVDDDIVDKFEFRCRPLDSDMIVPAALAVNKIEYSDMMNFSHPHEIYLQLIKKFGSYVNKFDKYDKLSFYGWNCKFDFDFLRSFFAKQGDKYFGSYFFWPPIDVAVLVSEWLGDRRAEIPDFHLNTVAEYLKLDLDTSKFHGALFDAEVTRKIYHEILS